MLNSLDRSECSCHNGFDKEKIMKKIEDYKVDAVVNFSFSSCPYMEEKTQSIHKFLTAQGVPALNFVTNYMEIYENDASYIKKITEFLHH
jgi:benzoyl-CoA reductase/2-hydroxyglutaryl-CoA dehydratase subunit BcrC/BadD/HgdB